jgi:hypothetical protein
LHEGKRKFGWLAKYHVTQNFILATRAEATAPVRRIGPNAKMKYAFPVANEICTHCSLGTAVRRAAGEQHERAGRERAEILIGTDLF